MNNITVKSWNINQKPTQIINYILNGNEKNNTHLLCLQEFSWEANPEYSFLQINKISNNLFYIMHNDVVVGIFSYNMGIYSSKPNVHRFPKYEKHGTLVIWNPGVFTFVGITTPAYYKLTREELGNRSSPIITLYTTNLKFLNIITVHGHATNSKKKNALFSSIFSQLSNSNVPTIICGDFNYNPNELKRLVPRNLVFNPLNTITHINAETGKTYNIDHVIHNELITINNLSIGGINQTTKTMGSLMKNNNHNHGILSFQITF